MSDDGLLKTRDFTSLRFTNTEVATNIEGVLQAILTRLAELPDRWPNSTTPNPSSEEEGRGHQ